MEKKIFVSMILLTLFVIFPRLVSAEISPQVARWNLVKKTGGFTAGVLSGFIFHELGHEIVARSEETELEWRRGEWYVPIANRSTMRKISVAGFGSQILSTEIMLRSKVRKDNSYILGWLAFNIINQIAYPLKHEFSSDGYGDLKSYKKNGGKVEYLEIGLVIHALWSAYRLHNNPNTPFFIKATQKEMQVGLKWKF